MAAETSGIFIVAAASRFWHQVASSFFRYRSTQQISEPLLAKLFRKLRNLWPKSIDLCRTIVHPLYGSFINTHFVKASLCSLNANDDICMHDTSRLLVGLSCYDGLTTSNNRNKSFCTVRRHEDLWSSVTRASSSGCLSPPTRHSEYEHNDTNLAHDYGEYWRFLDICIICIKVGSDYTCCMLNKIYIFPEFFML